MIAMLRRLLRRMFNARITRVLLWLALILLVAVGVNVIGITILGDVGSWERWLEEHRWHFFIWRLCVYGATAYGWWRMRQKLLKPDTPADDVKRFKRAELAAIFTVALFELSYL